MPSDSRNTMTASGKSAVACGDVSVLDPTVRHGARRCVK